MQKKESKRESDRHHILYATSGVHTELVVVGIFNKMLTIALVCLAWAITNQEKKRCKQRDTREEHAVCLAECVCVSRNKQVRNLTSDCVSRQEEGGDARSNNQMWGWLVFKYQKSRGLSSKMF